MSESAPREDKEPVSLKELAVYVTQDGLGKAGIVQRRDGLIQIYIHWIWPVGWIANNITSWFDDETPPETLYEDYNPRNGFYGTLDDAHREVMSIERFSDAVLKASKS